MKIKPRSIALETIDANTGHVVAYFDRPGRLEVSVTDGKLILHVYDGTEIDEDQLPLLVFDGTDPDYDINCLLSPRAETGYGRAGVSVLPRLLEGSKSRA